MRLKQGKYMDSPIPIESSTCDKCKNLIGMRRCKAFPERNSIPLEIWLGEHDHKTPFNGDNGIIFEYMFNGTSTKEEREEIIEYIRKYSLHIEDLGEEAIRYYRLTPEDFAL